MKFNTFSIRSSFYVDIIPQPTQSKSAVQSDQHISYLAAIFVACTIIGIMLVCIIRYRGCQKQNNQHSEKIIEIIESFNHTQKLKSEINQESITKRRQQIETLEKIWHQSSD